jgi:CRISPR type IV-associated protein Csf1
MSPISPSHLIRQATGAPNTGTHISQEDGHCALCAGSITKGEPVSLVRKQLDEKFNNKLDLAIPTSPLICGACNALRGPLWLRNLSKSVVHAGGVFKLASLAHRAHFILHPPPRPFVAFAGVKKMQHVAWRAAVTYGDDLIYFRLGDDQLCWSRTNLMRGFAAVQRLNALMALHKLKGRHPFSQLDIELKSALGTHIRDDVVKAAQDDPQGLEDVRILQALTLGELWALSILVITDLDKIEPPPPHNIDKATQAVAKAKKDASSRSLDSETD